MYMSVHWHASLYTSVHINTWAMCDVLGPQCSAPLLCLSLAAKLCQSHPLCRWPPPSAHACSVDLLVFSMFPTSGREESGWFYFVVVVIVRGEDLQIKGPPSRESNEKHELPLSLISLEKSLGVPYLASVAR